MKITTYDKDGNVIEEREVDFDVEDSQTLTVSQKAVEVLKAKVNDPAVNSISKIKTALNEFLEELV